MCHERMKSLVLEEELYRGVRAEDKGYDAKEFQDISTWFQAEKAKKLIQS